MDFKWKHFKSDIILRAVRWYVAYPLSYRQVEEMLKERGLEVDHSSIQRWVVEYSPQLAKKFASHKKAVGKSWRMDETYIKVWRRALINAWARSYPKIWAHAN